MIPWQEYEYAAYARRFGWTPEQVDRMPIRMKTWMFPIIEAMDKEQEKREERAAADAERRAKKGHRK